MAKPVLEIADIIRQGGAAFLAAFGASLSPGQRKVLEAIERCRTAALGGHLDGFDCGHQVPAYNSCRNRHCPKCLGLAKARWIKARLGQLLPVPYFHVVFTLPAAIAELALQNKRAIYQILFQTVSATLLSLAADPRHLGARIGFFAVLHTWGQQLLHHPHLHCVVPGGGIAPDGQRWVPCRCSVKGKDFFIHVKVLSARFKNLFGQALLAAFQEGRLEFHGQLAPLADPDAFEAWFAVVRQSPWVVYAKKPFDGPARVIEYLGRYTHRVAISNHRLVKLEDGQVSFRWKDNRHGGVEKTMVLAAVEFLRRFLLHVLPPAFVRIRYFGFLANCQAQPLLAHCRELLHVAPASLLLPTPPAHWRDLYLTLTGTSLRTCPLCHQGQLAWSVPLCREPLPRPPPVEV
jgi:hypothetical protein